MCVCMSMCVCVVVGGGGGGGCTFHAGGELKDLLDPYALCVCAIPIQEWCVYTHKKSMSFCCVNRNDMPTHQCVCVCVSVCVFVCVAHSLTHSLTHS
jgi:hypothetical protein